MFQDYVKVAINITFIHFIYYQRLPQKPQQKIVINKRVKGGLPFDVTALSDGDLARQLRSLGATVGPINDSTRALYQKKLAKLLTEELQAPSAPRITKLSPKQTKASPTKPQRKENADFSDENDVNDASTDELEVEMVEQLDYKHDQQDQDDSLPHKMPSPSYRSTPAKSTPRKRLATRTNTAKQESRKMHSENKSEMAKGLEQTDSIEIVAVKPTESAQEESSIFGPHVQILLAVLVFLGFTAFLVYYLMEEVPHHEITNGKTLMKK